MVVVLFFLGSGLGEVRLLASGVADVLDTP
jgi:hypothetical protein